ncbi:uncharacterized protein BJ212DRAFT_1480859 [Suillus subaureus]|uniref:Uncharacterized protein n=1 Tax=Suillus subaureus TaxID=48587 RepID=A0A9P7EB98_9AGAM|nr:uncharacterized protein BJ212DRAFT_1480859 [Suillus subaureus]KAG1816406.1 hypothetical protein BJ212DRAFT_1480859 [Suillus subaureus]
MSKAYVKQYEGKSNPVQVLDSGATNDSINDDNFTSFTNILVTTGIGSWTSELDEYLCKPVENVKEPLKCYYQQLHHYKKAKLVNTSPSVSPSESSEDPQAMNLEPEIEVLQVSEFNVASDVSMGKPDKGPSPNHLDQESDETDHADEVPYGKEEENNDMDELQWLNKVSEYLWIFK